MSDQFIGLPVDGPGKKLDTEELTVGANTVQRERNQLAGVGDDEVARIKDTEALGTDHGLVTREAPPVSPNTDYVTSSDLAIGSSVDLDAATIAAATTGKLMSVEVGSTVACMWEIKTRNGGVEVTRAVVFTSGLTGGRPSRKFTPPHKDYITLAGAGVDENFRVTVTNLGNQVLEAADVHATILWDEV